jgi:hypothetical protein
MTQQQKQKERPQQATRTVGEIVIATLDLLLSLPLIFVLVKVFQARAPGDNVNGTSAGLFLRACSSGRVSTSLPVCSSRLPL